MFCYGGNNRFGDRFDFYEWSAPYYENLEETFSALNRLELYGKTLVAINAIGACDCASKSELYRIMRNAGIELGERWWETLENTDNVLVPWRITLYEPVQFVFEDGTTVEILPIENGGARIGVNSIPIGLVDGLNPSRVKASELFAEFIGRRLEAIEAVIETKEISGIDRDCENGKIKQWSSSTEYAIKLDFGYQYALRLSYEYGGGYELGVKENCRLGNGRIEYKRLKDAVMPYDGAEIINGLGSGGSFWFQGIRDEGEYAIPNLKCFAVSTDDYNVSEYLTEFLYKYYDPSIQERYGYPENGFEWFGANLYTFASVRSMLGDIRRAVELLKLDFDNPELEPIKANWSYYSYTEKRMAGKSAKEIDEARSKAVSEAIDFYERFCSQMENVLKIPGNSVMSISGP